MDEPTKSERAIWDLKRQAQLLEDKRRKAYQTRLQEILAEYFKRSGANYDTLADIAREAFDLGKDFGANKMYEYL